jgi:hypothetical protein
MQNLEDALEYTSAASLIVVRVHDAALPEMNMQGYYSGCETAI